MVINGTKGSIFVLSMRIWGGMISPPIIVFVCAICTVTQHPHLDSHKTFRSSWNQEEEGIYVD